jgi:O-antigen/teichoic acid export membrane protein
MKRFYLLKKIVNKPIQLYKSFTTPVKAAFWFTVVNIVQKSISFLTMPIFTRVLSTEHYGQVNLYQSWLSIIMIFATLYLWGGVFNNGMIKYKNNRDEFISILQGLSTVTTLVFFVLYLSLKQFIGNLIELPDSIIIIMFIQILVTPALSFWITKERYEYRYKRAVMITIIIAITNPILGIIAVYATPYKGIARIISVAIVQIIACGIVYTYNFIKGKKFFDIYIWKYAIAFNIPLIPHYLSQTILNQADRIMINKYFTFSEVGIYSVAYTIGSLILIVNSGINSSLIPWIYQRLEKNDYSKINSKSKELLAFVAFLCIGFIIIIPELILLLAPKQYVQAIYAMPPIVVSSFFIFMYGLFANIEFYYEANKFVMIASIGAALLNIALNALLIPQFGFIIAGYTTLFSYIMYSVSHYIFMSKVSKKFINNVKIYDLRFLLTISTTILILMSLVIYLYSYIIIRYCFLIIILIVTFSHVKKKKMNLRSK